MEYNIDCIEFMENCNVSYDLIIADPPYFKIYGDFDFVWKSLDHYLDWSKTWIALCHKILKPTGSFYLWGKIGFGKGFPLFKLIDWIESNNLFITRNWITQRNSRGRGNKKGFVEAREELVFMTKSNDYVWNPVYLNQKTNRIDLGFNGKPRKNTFKRCTDVWTDITEASQSSKERFKLNDGTTFPTVKSIKLCQRIIQASTNVNDNVFIPFGGSGSEAVACKLLNRQFDLTEINPDYFHQIIKPRLISPPFNAFLNPSISNFLSVAKMIS